MTRRLTYILLGLLGGLAFWVLSELPSDWRDGRIFVALAILAAVFFSSALAMLGDLGARRAGASAVALGLVVAALGLWKSFGFSDGMQMLAAEHVVVALVALGTLPVPFLIAWGLGGRNGWTDYRVLFIESWNIVVRYAAAWLFVGVVWLVLWLLATLLKLVGVVALSELLGHAVVVWLVTGAVLGLGFSVVAEMPDMVSPYLLLRLFRLLLPLVLAVELVFVAALPLRGLTNLFGHLSAAGILLGTAMAAISLIAIAVDQDDVEAAHGPVLPVAGRGLALLLPVPAGLAIWAVVERVSTYGWTPARVALVAAIGVVALYAVTYALAALTGRHWMGWVRRANVAMALVMIGLAALWLTPLIAPEAIAVRSQMARYDAGRSRADELPLWEFAHLWGRSGEAALARLRDEAGASPDLATQLARLDRAQSRWDMMPAEGPAEEKRAEALRAQIAVLPAGESLPQPLLEGIARLADDSWSADCAAKTAAGNPACIVVLSDLLPARPGREALFVRTARSGDTILAFVERSGGWQLASYVFPDGKPEPAGAALIDALVTDAAPVPAALQALPFGDRQVVVLP